MLALATRSLIICGNFSAHHPSWRSAGASKPGREIVDEVRSTGLCIASRAPTGCNIGYRPALSTRTTSRSCVATESRSFDTPTAPPILISTRRESRNSTGVALHHGTCFRTTLLHRDGIPIHANRRHALLSTLEHSPCALQLSKARLEMHDIPPPARSKLSGAVQRYCIRLQRTRPGTPRGRTCAVRL